MEMKITALHEVDLAGKKVLFRPDINSPIDPVTKRIVNENRLSKNAVTLKYMLEKGAAVAIIAHQGDTQDYQNLIPMSEHAEKLSQLSGFPVRYIDDVCGPAALQEVRALRPGEAILLGNLRYLGEELSTFSNFVKLTPEQMQNVWHVRTLAPLFDLYVNDAFSAAHRNAPSMVGFPAVLPSAAGFQFVEEYKALSTVLNGAEHPSIFVLGEDIRCVWHDGNRAAKRDGGPHPDNRRYRRLSGWLCSGMDRTGIFGASWRRAYQNETPDPGALPVVGICDEGPLD